MHKHLSLVYTPSPHPQAFNPTTFAMLHTEKCVLNTEKLGMCLHDGDEATVLMPRLSL